jgi:hypothetical protein
MFDLINFDLSEDLMNEEPLLINPKQKMQDLEQFEVNLMSQDSYQQSIELMELIVLELNSILYYYEQDL